MLQVQVGYSAIRDFIPLSQMEGKWYVTRSNFKMWLKKDNRNPSFNYSIVTENGHIGLHDVVAYNKKKKFKKLVGFDKPLNSSNTSFVWRGKGLLSLFKSKWDILYFDDEIMIIHFEKTLFTAEGYDVVSRHKTLDPVIAARIYEKLKELGLNDLLIIGQD